MARKRKRSDKISFMFYSLIPLGYEYRRSLSTIQDPYAIKDGGYRDLIAAGVFFFRDSIHSNSGLIIPQPALKSITVEGGLIADTPFDAYVYQATAKAKAGQLHVCERKLDKGHPPSDLAVFNARKVKYGDVLWWDRWAKPVKVKTVTPYSLQLG